MKHIYADAGKALSSQAGRLLHQHERPDRPLRDAVEAPVQGVRGELEVHRLRHC